MEQKKIIIRTHSQVWNLNSKLFGLMNYPFPKPIEIRVIGYFAVVCALMYLLDRTGLITLVPFLIKYILIPFGAAQLLHKQNLDGKAPQRYLAALLRHLGTQRQYTERFEAHREKGLQTIRLTWWCSRGNPQYRKRKEALDLCLNAPLNTSTRI